MSDLTRDQMRYAKDILGTIDRPWRGTFPDVMEREVIRFAAWLRPIVERSEAHWDSEDAKPIELPDGTVLVPGRAYDVTVARWGSNPRTMRRRTLRPYGRQQYHSTALEFRSEGGATTRVYLSERALPKGTTVVESKP